MSLSAQFATSKESEVNGVRISYGFDENKNEMVFIVSRMSKANKRYTKALENATKPFRRQIELETMNPEQAEKLFMDVFVNTVLLGWENVPMSDINGDAKEKGYAPFDKKNATALLTRLPDLYDDLQEKAKKASLFRDSALEEEAKN